MKNKTILLLIGVLLFSSAVAQTSPSIRQYDAVMSQGTQPVYEMRIDNTNYKRAKNVWKGFVRKNFHKRLKKRSGEYRALGADYTPVSAQKFDLYSTVETSGNDAVLKVWFKTGDSFLSAATDSLHHAAVLATLADFHQEVRQNQATDAVTAEESNLKQAERNLSNLIEHNATLKKDIEDFKQKIIKAEQDIVDNEKAQIEAQTILENKRKALELVRDKLQQMKIKN